jgi:hypothetical protein
MSIYPTQVPVWGNRLSLQTNAAGAWMPITDEVTAVASRTMGRFMLNAYAMAGATVGPNDNTLALNNSDAFRAAAKAAWLAGGGIVTFPSGGGKYYMRPLTGVGDTSGKAVGSKQTRSIDGLQGPDGAGTSAGGTFGVYACMVLLPGVWVDLNGCEVIVENGWGSVLPSDGGGIQNYIATTLGADSNQGWTADNRIFNGRLNGNAANIHANVKAFNGVFFTRGFHNLIADCEIVDCYGTDGGGNHSTTSGNVSWESFAFKGLYANDTTVERVRVYCTGTTGTRGTACMSGGITWSYSSFAKVYGCTAYSIAASNGTSGNGFSNFWSNSIYHEDCWAYSCAAKGFNQEGGEDIRYVNCLAGGFTAANTSQPLGGLVTVGNGSGSATGYGFYFTSNMGGSYRFGRTFMQNCAAIGNGQKNLGVNTVREAVWSSQSGAGPFTTTVTTSTFQASEGPTSGTHQDGAFILVVDSTTRLPRGPLCRIASYVSGTQVTTNQNPTLYSAGTSTDNVVIINGLVEIDGFYSARASNGLDNSTSGNSAGAYQGLALRLRNATFQDNSADLSGGWGSVNGGGGNVSIPTGLMQSSGGGVVTQISVPASGQLLYNPFPYDCTVYIYSNGCTWTSSGIQLRSPLTHRAETVTSSANQTQTAVTPDTTAGCKDTLSVVVPQGAGIVLNYSIATPTWKWASNL